MQLNVGEDVITHCGKCKQRTFHVVFATEGPHVKRVQCKICMSYHAYHPDPGNGDESAGAGPGVRRRRGDNESQAIPSLPSTQAPPTSHTEEPTKQRASSSRSRKEPERPDFTTLWNQALDGKDLELMVNYSPEGLYHEGTVLNHPSFGVGVITRVSPVPERKMQVLFRDGFRTLVCRYPARMAAPGL